MKLCADYEILKISYALVVIESCSKYNSLK